MNDYDPMVHRNERFIRRFGIRRFDRPSARRFVLETIQRFIDVAPWDPEYGGDLFDVLACPLFAGEPAPEGLVDAFNKADERGLFAALKEDLMRDYPSAARAIGLRPVSREANIALGAADSEDCCERIPSRTESGETRGATIAAEPCKRRKRCGAEPMIAEHLKKRPHDSAEEVAEAVGWSVGVVAESESWKINQRRLQEARKEGIDPKAVKLDEKAVNQAGGKKHTQMHSWREAEEARDAALDRVELNKKIAKLMNANPGATPREIAKEIGCTAGDVERREAELNELMVEQASSAQEDGETVDEDTGRPIPQRRVYGHV